MTHWLRDPVVVRLALTLGVLVALEALFARHYSPVFPWHHVPGYAAVIGLVGCMVVVIVTKAVGKRVLQRPEGDDD